MQARISKEGEVVVVHLVGRVDVETAQPFRERFLQHLVGKKVVFDFRELSFVGSSGILPFLETMQDFARLNSSGMKFCGVSSEFRKVFAATTLVAVEIFDDQTTATSAFSQQAVPVAATPAPAVWPDRRGAALGLLVEDDGEATGITESESQESQEREEP